MKMSIKTLFSTTAFCLAFLLIAATQEADIPIDSAYDNGAASASSFTLHSDSLDVDFGDTPAGKAGLAKTYKLYARFTGTNAAGTTGSVKFHYAVSSDGSIFTTDNANRYVEATYNSNQVVVAAVKVDGRGVKKIKAAGYDNSGAADNGFDNLEMWVGFSE